VLQGWLSRCVLCRRAQQRFHRGGSARARWRHVLCQVHPGLLLCNSMVDGMLWHMDVACIERAKAPACRRGAAPAGAARGRGAPPWHARGKVQLENKRSLLNVFYKRTHTPSPSLYTRCCRVYQNLSLWFCAEEKSRRDVGAHSLYLHPTPCSYIFKHPTRFHTHLAPLTR
jgi:hypothetical protein